MPDSTPGTGFEIRESTADDDAIRCARCGHLLTRRRWAVSRREAHEHSVFNPAGRIFVVRCFSDAPGAKTQGVPSSDFTWFPGYMWTIASCANCTVHIGWRFESGTVFFALIKSAIAASDR